MKKILFINLLVIFSLALEGQVEKLLVPSDLKQQTIVTEPVTLRKGYLRPGIAFSYLFLDKKFSSSGEKEYLPFSTYMGNFPYVLSLEYGVTDRLQVEASVPFRNTVQVSNYTIYWPEADTTVDASYQNRGKGISDSFLGLKYQIIPDRETGISLIGSVLLTIPTGEKNPTNIKNEFEYDLPTGKGYYEIETGIRTKIIRYPYSFSGYLNYTFCMKGSRIIYASDKKETEFKDGNRFEAGGGVNYQLNDWISVYNDLCFRHTGEGEIYNATNEKVDPSSVLSYEPRLVFQVRRFRIGEGVRIPLIGKNTGADPIYALLFLYTF